MMHMPPLTPAHPSLQTQEVMDVLFWGENESDGQYRHKLFCKYEPARHLKVVTTVDTVAILWTRAVLFEDVFTIEIKFLREKAEKILRLSCGVIERIVKEALRYIGNNVSTYRICPIRDMLILRSIAT
jgi:hypothetical protein